MPLPFHALVPCGACGCHVRLSEKECPHCGAQVRDPDGALPRTKVAALMGLTAALLQPLACGGDVERRDTSSSTSAGGGDIQVASAYGVGPTTSFGNGGSGGTGVDGGKGGNGGGNAGAGGVASGNGGNGGNGRGGGDIMVASAYGVGPTFTSTGGGAGGNGGEGGLAGSNGSTRDGGVDGDKGGG
jgi:hypothetical protein